MLKEEAGSSVCLFMVDLFDKATSCRGGRDNHYGNEVRR